MPGILPETVNGGLPYRSAVSGACSVPGSVQNAYCPDPQFTTSCDLTALPSDCTARITAAQINALVSEMVALAECFDPTGTWACTSINNLCAAFSTYRSSTGVGTLAGDMGTIACASPLIVIDDDTTLIVCDGAGNLSRVTPPAGFGVSPPFDVNIFFPGVPANNQFLHRVPIPRSVIFPLNLTGSYAKAAVAATAAVTMLITRNGTTIGSVNFALGATNGTFTFAAPVTFVAGDILAVVNQASTDATLADIGIVMVGAQ